MKQILIMLLACLLCLAGCASGGQDTDTQKTGGYRQIGQADAQQMMAQDDGHIVVDVRRSDEYAEGHIPGAICIPNESIGGGQPEELPNLEQILLVYCRSGNRSVQAAEKLASLGYTHVYEFGGILDWTGEIVSGQTLTLTLQSNPTTGFSWEAAQDEELFDVQSFYLPQPQSKPVSGSGGWQTFVLTPKQAGTVQISFTYSRSWESSDVDPQLSYTFEIAEDFSISVTADGGEQAAAQGYPPTVRIY